jgi:hypothetical protein
MRFRQWPQIRIPEDDGPRWANSVEEAGLQCFAGYWGRNARNFTLADCEEADRRHRCRPRLLADDAFAIAKRLA